MVDPAGAFPDSAAVEALAALAGLKLDRERAAAVSGILQAWRPACLELNRAMRAPAYDLVVPATVLLQPPPATAPADA